MIDRRTFIGSLATLGVTVLYSRDMFGTAAARPAEILLIRHGEEPAHGPHLNARGKARAEALSRLFKSRFTAPAVLFATRTTPQSARPVETITPLSAALGLKIDDRFGDSQYLKLASEILYKPEYAGKHVLICWHHGTMGVLATSLGVVRPPVWPPKDYDHIWQIRYAGSGATMTDERQHLLPDDPKRPAPQPDLEGVVLE